MPSQPICVALVGRRAGDLDKRKRPGVPPARWKISNQNQGERLASLHSMGMRAQHNSVRLGDRAVNAVNYLPQRVHHRSHPGLRLQLPVGLGDHVLQFGNSAGEFPG